MDPIKLNQLKSDLLMIKGLNSGMSAATGILNQTAFPVTGPMVNISTFTTVATLMKNQSDLIDKLANVIDKLLDELR